MGNFAQPAVLRVDTPLGPDALLLERFAGREALSEPFRYRLDLLAEAGTPVPFDGLLGRGASVRLTLPDGATRHFHGIINRLTQDGQVPGSAGAATFVRYRAELVPRLWLLTKRVRSRIFQQSSVPDILRAVLAGLDVSYQIQGAFHPRDHCTQYRESDFHFAGRLMEEEGIYYFFRHTAAGHQLVLANSPGAHPDVPGPTRLIYEPVAGGSRAEDRILTWSKSQEIRAGRYTLRDHCFEIPDDTLQASRTIPEMVVAGGVTHKLHLDGTDATELFDYPGRYAQRFDGISPGGGDRSADLAKIFDDGQRTAGIRIQQEAAPALVVAGEGGCRQLAAGHKFTLERHFDGDGPYVLTHVEHEASVEGTYATGREAPLTYRNRFGCIPHAVPYRPQQVTPRPRVEGPQTAVVVGPPGGDPIFTDKYGRVKVQFRWDRLGKSDADSSCWIRVAQPWAGSNWGALTLPRIGQEVVVAFLAGDPDAPVILGSVYNADQMPPFPLPEKKTQSGIKTRSHLSDSGADFSGLGFEDADGTEHVHLHSQRDLTHSAEDTVFVNAGVAHHQHVGRLSVRQVGGLPLTNHSTTVAGGGFGAGDGDAGGSGPGRGGGSESGVTPDPPPNPAARKPGQYYWNPAVAGGIAKDLQMVLGWMQVNTVGVRSTTTFGQNNTTSINPLGLIDSTNMAASAIAPALSGLTAMFASATVGVTMGAATQIQWGPQINFRRGNSTVEFSPKSAPANPFGAASKVFGLLYSTLTLSEMLMPMMEDELTKYTGDATLSTEVIAGLEASAIDLTLGLWVGFETASLIAAQTAALALPLPAPVISLPEAIGSGIVGVFKAIGKGFKDLGEALKDLGAGPGGVADRSSGVAMKASESLYSIAAPRIALISSPTLIPSEPTLIDIQSISELPGDGNVIIAASTSTAVVGGEMASVLVETQEEVTGKVTVDCGPEGTILLQSGIVREPNSLVMEPAGITVSSVPKITLESDESRIMLDAEGITESVAESVLSITPEGITLTVAESIIEITPEGITLTSGPSVVEITAEGIVINGATISLAADEELSVAAPVSMIE